MSDEVGTKKNVTWVLDPEKKGKMLFTFDGETMFNLFRDYPHALSEEQKRIFDAENPYWAEFFRERVQQNV